MKTIAVLITCHNRRVKTLTCLEALFANTLPIDYKTEVFLVDDGSKDGTSEVIRENYPLVNIIQGNGNLFWNRGMHLAFSKAMHVKFDNYLWLNDDTFIYPNAIRKLIDTLIQVNTDNAIIVGATCDPITGKFTYGGARHTGRMFRPFLCEHVLPNGQPQEIDVMNGNFVLIPHTIAKTLKNLDPLFEHAMGDTDYSMRARKLGIKIFLIPDYIGNCSINDNKGTHLDKTLSITKRLHYAMSRKGLPLRSWFLMCWRHGGLLWPIHFTLGYVKIIFNRR